MKIELKKLHDEYIEYCKYSKRLRPETIKGYEEVFRHFSTLMPEIKDTGSLSVEIMNRFFKKLQVRKRIVGRNTEKVGVKDSTIRTYWSKLNSFFAWLHQKKLITNDLLDKKNRPPLPIYDNSPALNKDKVEKIYSAILLNSKKVLMLKRDTAMISTLLFTGIRKTEFISLTVLDVDLEKRIITIRGSTSKSKRTRQVPINETLFIHIKDYLNERNRMKYRTQKLFVSTNRDVGLTEHGLKHWIKRLEQLSGVKFHLHQFRHTFACSLARSNVSIAKIQKLMGHTDLRMTERYLRSIGVEDMRDDISRLSIDNLV